MQTRISDKHLAIIGECRDKTLHFCEQQLGQFVEQCEEFFFQQANKAKSDQEQTHFFEIREAIIDGRDELTRVMIQHTHDQFAELTGAKTADTQKNYIREEETPPQDSTSLFGDLSLDLVENDKLELEIAFTNIIQQCENNYSNHLFALQQRFTLLNSGKKLEEADLPVYPSVFNHGLDQFLDTTNTKTHIKVMVIKLFDRHFIRNLSTLYQHLNDYLADMGIFQNLRDKSDRGNIKTGNRAENKPEKNSIDDIPHRRRKTDHIPTESEKRQVELFDSIRALLSSLPISNIASPTQTVAPTELMTQLSQLQHQQFNALSSHQAVAIPQSLPKSSEANSRQTIECVGLLFDSILNDDSLSDTTKALLSHLHTPLLKVAIIDDSFLRDAKHPARELLDCLVTCSERWLSYDDTFDKDVYKNMENVIRNIIKNFSDDISIFSSSLDEFKLYVGRLEKKAALIEERSRQAAKGKEKLLENSNQVASVIRQKIAGETLPKPIYHLIVNHWAAYLSVLRIQFGEESQEWKDALCVVDDILWYMEPKINDKDKATAKKLAKDLYIVLEHGLNTVGQDTSEVYTAIKSLEMCQQLATENALGHNNIPDDSAKEPSTEVADSETEQTASEEKTIDTKEDTPTENIAADNTADTADETTNKTSESTDKETKLNIPDLEEAPSTKAPADVIDQLSKLSAEVSTETITVPSDIADGPKYDESLKPMIDSIMSWEFGTQILWQEPNQRKRKVKLSWYNKRTQNCMLSNQMGQQIALKPAYELAAMFDAGIMMLADEIEPQPFFERTLENILSQLRLKSKAG